MKGREEKENILFKIILILCLKILRDYTPDPALLEKSDNGDEIVRSHKRL